MSEAPTPPVAPPPPRGSILKVTLLAIGVAALVLVAVVLPAEYGIDPLGTGEMLGLTGITRGGAATDVITPDPDGPLTPQQVPYKIDAIELTVFPGRFIEYKYYLEEGAPMIYMWSATAPLEIDFHTEPAGQGPEASDSFERGTASSGRGSYVAPYAGIHGWYWRNPTDRPVTITLNTAGFYSQARMFADDGVGEPVDVQDPAPPPTW